MFYEDRDDVYRRAMPRSMVGGLIWMVVLTGGFCLAAHDVPPAPYIYLVPPSLWALWCLCRIDLYAAQFGPRVHDELDDGELRAYRGAKLTRRIPLDRVIYWKDAPAVPTWVYWCGAGAMRTMGGLFSVPAFSFDVRDDSGRRRTVSPPALFRWDDRGGCDDLVAALADRIGAPNGLDRKVDEA